VRTEGVPFARVESGFTRDFEDLVAWLATGMDKTAVRRLVRVAWQTVGAICQRVVADRLDHRPRWNTLLRSHIARHSLGASGWMLTKPTLG